MQSQITSISPPSLLLPLSIGPSPRLSAVFLSSYSTILLSLKALQSLDYKFPSSFFSSYCFTINLALWSVLSLQFFSYLHAFLLLELCQCFTPPTTFEMLSSLCQLSIYCLQIHSSLPSLDKWIWVF